MKCPRMTTKRLDEIKNRLETDGHLREEHSDEPWEWLEHKGDDLGYYQQATEHLLAEVFASHKVIDELGKKAQELEEYFLYESMKR